MTHSDADAIIAHDRREEVASQADKKIQELASKMRDNYYALGTFLKVIRDNELWQELNYNSFSAYLANPDISVKKSSAYDMIKIVETFPNYPEIAQIPSSKLRLVAGYVNEENREELTDMAETLAYGDLLHEVKQKYGSPDSHAVRELPKIYRCRDCHGIKGMYFDELCSCGWTDEETKAVSDLISKINSGTYAPNLARD